MIDTRISQSEWSDDTLDGFGKSGYAVDETKANIGIIDLEWLGVGRVRCGFVMDGRIIYTHEFNNANNIETVYMTRASLPVRYEVISDASATTSSSLVQICSTVISEGGYEPFGSIRSASNDITVRTVAATAFLPLIAIRLRSAYNKASLVVKFQQSAIIPAITQSTSLAFFIFLP